MSGLRRGREVRAPNGPLKAADFLIECQTCRRSYIVAVPLGYYVPSRCAVCREGLGLTPIEGKPDNAQVERGRYRFRE